MADKQKPKNTHVTNSNNAGSKSGMVAVIGLPNAGKSTLINTLVGTKVTIVSPKIQTTRNVVRGIAIHDNAQIVFMDTPGIFKPGERLHKAMVSAAWQTGEDADMVLYIFDVSRPQELSKAKALLNQLANRNKAPCLLVLNKVDKIGRDKLLPLAQDLNDHYDFTATFMVSALKGKRTDDILDYIAENLDPGPWLYPEDQISDLPALMLAEEITREKLFRRLHQELPYGVAVETESWDEQDDGSLLIKQLVYVQRDSHKGIALGKNGAMIKSVGTAARKELTDLFGQPVHLKLFVKVNPEWADDPDHYRRWGLEYPK